MHSYEQIYESGGVRLTGYFADGAGSSKVPGVLVIHEATGIGEHMRERARMLAQRGYVAFALDLYGTKDLSLEEARQHAQALMAQDLIRPRARAALELLAAHPSCDPARLAAIGFCMGGRVALELAKDGAPIHCAVGFHPGFKPSSGVRGPIAAKILMMVGDEDPVVSVQDRENFAREMKEAGADWQLHVFGGVGHSYTNRAVDALGMPGFRYDERTDRRAWQSMLALFEERLG
jgi:dienelactone hydrolase